MPHVGRRCCRVTGVIFDSKLCALGSGVLCRAGSIASVCRSSLLDGRVPLLWLLLLLRRLIILVRCSGRGRQPEALPCACMRSCSCMRMCVKRAQREE